jgi:hypothetical protein
VSVKEDLWYATIYKKINKSFRPVPGHPHMVTFLLFIYSFIYFTIDPQGHSQCSTVFSSLFSIFRMQILIYNTTSSLRFGINMFTLLLSVPIQQITMAFPSEYFWKMPQEEALALKRTGGYNSTE